MNKMRNKVMLTMVRAEDMPLLIEKMTDKIFVEIPIEYRTQFISKTMLNCMETIFDKIDNETRLELIQEMMEKMVPNLKNILIQSK